MTSCVEWGLNELSSSYSSRGNWKIVCQKRNTVTLGQAEMAFSVLYYLGFATIIVDELFFKYSYRLEEQVLIIRISYQTKSAILIDS